MRFTDRVYRSLVMFNTLAVVAILLAGVFICVLKRDVLAQNWELLLDREAASSKFLASTNLHRGDDAPIEYPLYDIRISPANLRQVQIQVRQLLDAGMMTDALKIWYPARFYHEGEQYKVKIRLRGDFPNHWAKAKKSWRVRFDKQKLFQGRRSIDFIIPKDKGYEIEPLSYDVARELGLLVPDAGFCRIRLNGVDFGLYLWIEKYGQEMLEKQGYPVGEIFRERNVRIQTRFNAFGVSPDYYTACFNNAVRSDPSTGYYAQRWDKLVTLVRQADDLTFRREIPHLINIENYLTWNALTWLFGSTHAHAGDNLRWFYDNTSGLFAPILYDVYRYPVRLPETTTDAPPRWKFERLECDRLTRRIIGVPEYRQRRNEILWGLLNDDRFDLARRSDQYFQRLRRALLTGVDAPASATLDDQHAKTIQILIANRQDLRDHLAFARIFVTPILALTDGTPHIRLRLLPDSRNNIKIERLTLAFSEEVAASVQEGGVRAILTDPSGSQHAVEGLRVTVPDPKAMVVHFSDLPIWTPVAENLDQVAAEWLLQLELPGTDPGHWQKPGFLLSVQPYCRNSVTHEPLPELYTMTFPLVYQFSEEGPSPITWALDEFIAHSELPFARHTAAPDLRVRRSSFSAGTGTGRYRAARDGDVLVLPKGQHLVKRDLTVPAGCGLRLEAGAVLKMAPGVSVVCYGPLTVPGSADEPVRIVPQEPGKPWGSFAVVRAGQPSRVQHLHVAGGSEAYVNGLYLSGQLCFYWSDVRLEHCSVTDARADDGLNIKKAAFSIRHCLFRDNSFDALDGDWVRGTVQSSVFSNNGGDGVDLSGSRVVVRDCLLTNMGDKAVSVGEASRLFAFNSVIRDSLTGVASKDLSDVSLYACVFYQNQTAVALYRKKQVFGGATGQAVGSLFWDNERAVTADAESSFAALASGVDHWPATERVTGKNLLRGDPGRYYTCDERGNILHNRADIPMSPFRITTQTGEATFGELTVPDLSGAPAGLLRPLALDARQIEQLARPRSVGARSIAPRSVGPPSPTFFAPGRDGNPPLPRRPGPRGGDGDE